MGNQQKKSGSTRFDSDFFFFMNLTYFNLLQKYPSGLKRRQTCLVEKNATCLERRCVMKKISVKNYLLIALFALIIVGVIYLSILSGSVKYFGFFIITLSVLLVVLAFIQRANHTNAKHYKSRTREQLLRHQFRK